MGSQGEGLIGMICLALIGMLLGTTVHRSGAETPILILAYVACHFVLAIAIVLGKGLIMLAFAREQQSPNLLLTNCIELLLFPAAGSAFLIQRFAWHTPTSGFAFAASWIGAWLCPLLALMTWSAILDALEKRKRK